MINLKYMKKKILLFVAIVLAVIIVGLIYNYSSGKMGSRTSSSGGSFMSITVENSETSTSSPTYFIDLTTASSTKEIDTEYAGNQAYEVCLTASSTATGFVWTEEYTDTDVAANTDWFDKLDYTETSSILRTWGASQLVNVWTPANDSASTTCAQLFDPEDLLAVRTKITYNVAGDNGAVFFRSLTK